MSSEPDPPPKTEPKFVIKGAKAPPPAEKPDPRKVLEKTTNALGGLLNPLKAKIAAIQQKPEAPAPPPAAPVEPAPPEPVAEAPAPPTQPRPTASLPRPANVTLDHLVLRVGEGTGHKAAQVLVRKGIKDAKVEGDRLEFTCLSNRVTLLFKTLFESHIELYGLERTVKPDEETSRSP